MVVPLSPCFSNFYYGLERLGPQSGFMLGLRERERDGGGWGLLRRSMDASVLLDWRDQREMEVFRPRSDLDIYIYW